MYNFRIAISPSGEPHIGNFYIILANYFLKIKILGNIILRFDDTNEKKNKLINKFYILKKLKNNGIFIKKILKQKNFINLYIKKSINLIKNSFNKYFLNKKIKKNNINYCLSIILKKCNINYFDNNYGNFIYKISIENIILIKNIGIPTYNFSTLIDDFYNNTIIIIRGKEWLNQIPFQLSVCKKYNFFFNFNHLSNINNFNGKKLSKRNLFFTKKFNIFIFLKKIKKIFNKIKDLKYLILEKKKKKINKINNYIMINLISIIQNIKFDEIINFIKIKIILIKYLKNIKIKFSNLNFSFKLLKDVNNFYFFKKVKLLILKIKKYEFI
ncbi:glutamate--tRNA ligase family protein [Candidatus Carsonella ruddii]|uniref:glutamate--tRNA ligase family protein n=1 Tax=Carsonella ruddii TaxID=114186 RepID=UPI003D9A200F